MQPQQMDYGVMGEYEDQLGATYNELEWAMEEYDNSKENRFVGRDQEVFDIFTKLHLSNQHKMCLFLFVLYPKN